MPKPLLFVLYINDALSGIRPSEPTPTNVVTVNVIVSLVPAAITGIFQVIVFATSEAEPFVVIIEPVLKDKSGFITSVITELNADSAPVFVIVILYPITS